MTRPVVLAGLAGIAALIAGAQADAAQIYTYKVDHPAYGEIGTYTSIISEENGTTRILSQVRVAVSILGIVMYRENADRTEIFRDGRLVGFESMTDKNGEPFEVRGEAERDRFVITSPAGTVSAPADVAPSDPWAIRHLGPGTMISTKSGAIHAVDVTGGEPAAVTVRGISVATRHFHVQTAANDDAWEVWLDAKGVPVKFRSIESGTPVDFVLIDAPAFHAAAPEGAAPPARIVNLEALER